MKAILINQFGTSGVLALKETPSPTLRAGELLMKVKTAAINPVDYKIRNGSLKFITGRKFPKVLGGDVAGIVEESFEGSRFKPGDRVYGMLSFKGGGYGEFVAIPEHSLSMIPDGMDFVQASAIPLAGLTALQSLVEKGKMRSGSKILINGASGGVGHFAVQIAKAYGAMVHATCSTRNVDFVKSLGADKVYDYTKKEPAQEGYYDIYFDAVASQSPGAASRFLRSDGIYITTLPSPAIFLRQALNFVYRRKCYAILTKPLGTDLDKLSGLFLEGKLKPEIEKIYKPEEAAEAHNRIETGRVRGKLVIEWE